MEYILGSLITILSMLVIRYINKKSIVSNKLEPIKYSQTNVYDMLKPFIGQLNLSKYPIVTQATKHNDEQHVRVVLAGHKAYWILDNIFYEADQINGFIDKESAKPVDTITMDKVQLDKMITIVETLTEGKSDEDWNSRN